MQLSFLKTLHVKHFMLQSAKHRKKHSFIIWDTKYPFFAVLSSNTPLLARSWFHNVDWFNMQRKHGCVIWDKLIWKNSRKLTINDMHRLRITRRCADLNMITKLFFWTSSQPLCALQKLSANFSPQIDLKHTSWAPH